MAFINVKFTRKENYEEFNCAPGTVMKETLSYQRCPGEFPE